MIFILTLIIINTILFSLPIHYAKAMQHTVPVQPTNLGYENIDAGSSWGWYCNQTSEPTNSLEAVTDPKIEGSRSLKATLTTDAIKIFGGERAEVYYCDYDPTTNSKEKHLFTEGQSVWYHWYTILPEKFAHPQAPDKEWYVFTQWHGERTGDAELLINGTKYDDRTSMGVPLGLSYNVNKNSTTGSFTTNILAIRVAGGLFDGEDPNKYYRFWDRCLNSPILVPYFRENCGFIWWEESPQEGKWYEFKLHVIWSQTNGLVEGEVKIDGMQAGTGNKTDPNSPFQIHYEGPTLNPFPEETTNPQQLPGAPNGTSVSTTNDAQVYLKQGIYRFDEINEAQTVHNDGMQIARCPSTHDKDYDPFHYLCIGEQSPPFRKN
jgi:hypothetical protein